MKEYDCFLELYGDEDEGRWCSGLVISEGGRHKTITGTHKTKLDRQAAWRWALSEVVFRACAVWQKEVFAITVPSAELVKLAEAMPEVVAALRAHGRGDVEYWPHRIRPRLRLDEALSAARGAFEAAKVVSIKKAVR